MNQRFPYAKTLLLGFGFFGISLIWPIFNNFVPVFLKEDFGLSASLGVLFGSFHPVEAASPWTGFLIHLAISGIYGIIFGLVWSTAIRLRRMASSLGKAILAGAVYGLLLWLVAQFILLPGSGSSLRFLPVGQFLSAHLVYGLILGWRYGRI